MGQARRPCITSALSNGVVEHLRPDCPVACSVRCAKKSAKNCRTNVVSDLPGSRGSEQWSESDHRSLILPPSPLSPPGTLSLKASISPAGTSTKIVPFSFCVSFLFPAVAFLLFRLGLDLEVTSFRRMSTHPTRKPCSRMCLSSQPTRASNSFATVPPRSWLSSLRANPLLNRSNSPPSR